MWTSNEQIQILSLSLSFFPFPFILASFKTYNVFGFKTIIGKTKTLCFQWVVLAFPFFLRNKRKKPKGRKSSKNTLSV